MMKSFALALINTVALCIVIVVEKELFRIFNIGFQNMLIFWGTLAVTFMVVSLLINEVVAKKLLKE